MSSPTLVWAFRPLTELKGATGYVDAGPLAESLLAAGVVQHAQGWEHFKPVEGGAMTPGLAPSAPTAPSAPGGTRRAKPEDEGEHDEDADATAEAKASARDARGKPRGKVTK